MPYFSFYLNAQVIQRVSYCMWMVVMCIWTGRWPILRTVLPFLYPARVLTQSRVAMLAAKMQAESPALSDPAVKIPLGLQRDALQDYNESLIPLFYVHIRRLKLPDLDNSQYFSPVANSLLNFFTTNLFVVSGICPQASLLPQIFAFNYQHYPIKQS